MNILISWEPTIEPVDEITIDILPCYDFIKPHPPLDRIPKGMFRCFICLQTKTPKHFGDYLHDQKVCKECYSFASEWGVGCLIQFDRRRGFTYA